MNVTQAGDTEKGTEPFLSGSSMEGEDELSETVKLVLDRTRTGKWKPKVEHFENVILREEPSCLDFNKERQRCLAENKLFEDPEFPADIKSICLGKAPEDLQGKEEDIEWLRPNEIVEKPQLITKGLSRVDAKQGKLGDCYFVAAMATLAMHEELFYRVVPLGQSFTKDYAGIFHFHIWHYGKWVDVVIDDRLPTLEGKLFYGRSKDENEFWCALLEKAYAKVYGSYEAIEGGDYDDAITDLTGDFVESYEPGKTRTDELLCALARTRQPGIMACCGTGEEEDKEKLNGLSELHAYSITELCQVSHSNGSEVNLVRIRNPWANDGEWQGDWSDKSTIWKKVGKDDRKKLVRKKDGEFWMSIDDFKEVFTDAVVSTLNIHSKWELYQMTGKEEWKTDSHYTAFADGRWAKSDVVAESETLSKKEFEKGVWNRGFQYVLHIPDAKKSSLANSKCNVKFMLTRKYLREQISSKLAKYLVCAKYTKLLKKRRSYGNIVQRFASAESGNRDVTMEVIMEPGCYYLVFAGRMPLKKETEFHLRAVADGPFEMMELTPTGSTNIEVHEWLTESAA